LIFTKSNTLRKIDISIKVDNLSNELNFFVDVEIIR
jgi:hypothetical protein